MEAQQAKVETGSKVEETFAGMAIEKSGELAASAVAAQAQAIIQARYIMAWKRPRDLDQVRQRLLSHCKRPAFAAAARYYKPVGDGVVGWTVRFAEAAIQAMTNVWPESKVIFDSPEKRLITISVTDLESNVPYSADIVIDKTKERSRLPDGETPISTRVNSKGKITYLLPATEDDILNKQNSAVSKQLRTQALRLVPSDFMEEALATIHATLDAEDSKDPDATRKKLIDSFAAIGVKVAALKEYVGHDLDSLTPPELAHLRGLYAGLRDGETTWADALTARKGGAAPATNLKDRAKAKADAARAKNGVSDSAETKPAHDPQTGELPHEPTPAANAPKDDTTA